MALALGCLFGKWPWPWGACWGECLEGLEGFGEFGGFGAFAGWQTAALKAYRVFGGFWRVWSVCGLANTPAVVPGAAPALAKAGVGGFFQNKGFIEIPLKKAPLRSLRTVRGRLGVKVTAGISISQRRMG